MHEAQRDRRMFILVLRTANGSSVDRSEITWLTALKPPTDFCRRVLGAMVMHLSLVLCLVWPNSSGVARSNATADNPAPAAGDLTLPMPRGRSMVFRPVFIGKGSNPFILRQFQVGDPTDEFKEYLTRVGIGGAFLAAHNGQPEWLYYLGKYEISQAQYAVVMDIPAPPPEDSRYPIRNISWFEAQTFIHRYNLWLFAHAKEHLPRRGQRRGFLRLPTEAEWEFAARGGIASSPEAFRAQHPYTAPLAKHEWFSGASSSHDEVQLIGGLAPNALFLHDMLGNVAEMTWSLYQVEYYQGSVGGFVARGGHFGTDESRLRGSLRIEQPFYNPKLQPHRSPTLGLRLAISNVIFTKLNTAQLRQHWEEWRGSRTRRESPAGSSTAPPTTQTNIELVKVAKIVQEVLGESALPDTTKRQLEIVQASFGTIEATIKQAEVDHALAWARMATTRGLLIADGFRRVKELRGFITRAQQSGLSATVIASTQQNLQRMLAIIDTRVQEYGESLRQLRTFENDSREQAFTHYRGDLIRTGNAARLRVLEKAVTKHVNQPPKHPKEEYAQWKSDLKQL